jgi:hypothetical protein
MVSCVRKYAGRKRAGLLPTFNVKGKPRIVHVQFGTDDEGDRDFLRWPDCYRL